ncbi:YdeI/OmpD-associated family protein [Pararhizobium sp.]|uniref:YdeI/OmpD-associated family protein n=1 Tax=Pararhizobium sp. TaxID=1977563 RepID=UPI00271C0A8C|nr:YdeI/OmpD-associated family protein [Pararhizobium sp.]MDO9414723.1 YdeI/OmpD-associated family protein [Pararhizobium sp.]
MDVDLTRVHAFATPTEFCAWLAGHHGDEREIWLKLYKKSSRIASITWAEAVVEALAWGWIDGIAKSNDEVSWFQRFTPRKPKSGWSKINRQHVERLIAEGRMQAPGLDAVAAAKADGRWEAAYAGSATMAFSETFLAAVAEDAAAKKTFDSLTRRQLFSFYHRLQTAKREETRQKLTVKMIGMLSRGETFP